MLGWLLGIPLALLLGWLVWTIATGNDDDPVDETPTTTATQDQPVTTEEARRTVQAFYTALQDEGLDAARRYLVDGVPVDEAIDVDLTGIEVTIESAEEAGEGVEVVAVAAYAYGDAPRVITQRETLQVARRGTEALIVQRVTQTVSDSADNQGGGEGSGEENPADENSDEGQGDGDNSGPGNDEGQGNDNSGPGNNNGNGNDNGNGNGNNGDGSGSTGGPGDG